MLQHLQITTVCHVYAFLADAAAIAGGRFILAVQPHVPQVQASAAMDVLNEQQDKAFGVLKGVLG